MFVAKRESRRKISKGPPSPQFRVSLKFSSTSNACIGSAHTEQAGFWRSSFVLAQFRCLDAISVFSKNIQMRWLIYLEREWYHSDKGRDISE
jgi:hypothetical protein